MEEQKTCERRRSWSYHLATGYGAPMCVATLRLRAGGAPFQPNAIPPCRIHRMTRWTFIKLTK